MKTYQYNLSYCYYMFLLFDSDEPILRLWIISSFIMVDIFLFMFIINVIIFSQSILIILSSAKRDSYVRKSFVLHLLSTACKVTLGWVFKISLTPPVWTHFFSQKDNNAFTFLLVSRQSIELKISAADLLWMLHIPNFLSQFYSYLRNS
jgi:hypothetical protein